MRFLRALALGLGVLCSYSYAAPPASAGQVTVYSSREAQFVEPLLRVFEGLTGHRVIFVHVGADLITGLKQEGWTGKADLLIASEFSQLVEAKRQGFSMPVSSAVLRERVPDVYRDTDGHWYGLTRRARVIVTSATRPAKGRAVTRYEDLADPSLRGRVCIRSGKHPYNVALIASLIAHVGAKEAERWVNGLKSNLARKPTGGDRDQILAVHRGECDVAVVNSYYIPAMLKSDQVAMREAASDMKVVLPNATDRGTHVTISGMAVPKGARNLAEVHLLMDFLTSPPAVRIFSLDNEEYPVLEDQRSSDLLASWGAFEPENIALDRLAPLMPVATAIIDKLRFDDGAAN